jgi:hypothetical protein
MAEKISAKTLLKNSKSLLKIETGNRDVPVTRGLSSKSIKALKELVKEEVAYCVDKKHLPLEKAFKSEVCEVAAHIPSVDLKILGKYGLVESVEKVSVVTVQGVVYKMSLNEPILVPMGFFDKKKVHLSHKASKYVDVCLDIAERQKKDRAVLNRLIEEAKTWEELINAWPPASALRPANLIPNAAEKLS